MVLLVCYVEVLLSFYSMRSSPSLPRYPNGSFPSYSSILAALVHAVQVGGKATGISLSLSKLSLSSFLGSFAHIWSCRESPHAIGPSPPDPPVYGAAAVANRLLTRPMASRSGTRRWFGFRLFLLFWANTVFHKEEGTEQKARTPVS